MSTLAEIEEALPKLTPEELAALRRKLDAIAPEPGKRRKSLRDIPTFNVGKILKPVTSEDDILGEMLHRTARFRFGEKPTREEMNER